jgi:hypothetical protein
MMLTNHSMLFLSGFRNDNRKHVFYLPVAVARVSSSGCLSSSLNIDGRVSQVVDIKHFLYLLLAYFLF